MSGLFMQASTVLIAVVLSAAVCQKVGNFVLCLTVSIAIGLTLSGIAMFRRGVSLRPSWDQGDLSASRLTTFQHCVAVIGGVLVFSLRGKMLGGPTIAFFIIESAFLLTYVNYILLSVALKIQVDRSTWGAILLLTAAWYATFDRLS